MPLHDLDQWTLNDGEYVHTSGKFFTIKAFFCKAGCPSLAIFKIDI